MPVVANGNTETTDPGVVYGCAGVPRCVVVLLVATRIVCDVHHHPGLAEQCPIGVNHRRGVITAVAVQFKHIHDDYQPECFRSGGDTLCRLAWNPFS